MSCFNLALSITLANEGGYVAPENDLRGGETYRGISRKYWPKWEGWEILDSYKTSPDFPECLSDADELNNLIASFYHSNFWSPIMGDNIDPQTIASKLFDMAVLMGIYNAVVLIQKAIDDVLKTTPVLHPLLLSIDGKMGSFTYSAINGLDSNKLLDCYKQRCIKYYEDLDQPEFIKGWTNRVMR